MAGLKPKIVVIDSLHQDGTDTATVASQGIGKDLIAYQCRPGCRDPVLAEALSDALGKRLFGVGDAIHTVVSAEDLYPVFAAVGHHAHLQAGSKNILDPGIHLLRGLAGGIGHDSIVKVQHQQFNALLCQKFWGQIGEFFRNESRKQRKTHK